MASKKKTNKQKRGTKKAELPRGIPLNDELHGELIAAHAERVKAGEQWQKANKDMAEVWEKIRKELRLPGGLDLNYNEHHHEVIIVPPPAPQPLPKEPS